MQHGSMLPLAFPIEHMYILITIYRFIVRRARDKGLAYFAPFLKKTRAPREPGAGNAQGTLKRKRGHIAKLKRFTRIAASAGRVVGYGMKPPRRCRAALQQNPRRWPEPVRSIQSLW